MMDYAYMPWQINLVLQICCFITLLWQTYYCQMLFSIALDSKMKIILREGSVVVLLSLVAYLIEEKYGYIFTFFVMPLVWYRIWANTLKYKSLVYRDINYNTYKQAWDLLPVPVAFANADQEIVLFNEAMYNFLANVLHKKVRNMKVLWRSLEQLHGPGLTVLKEEGHLVIRQKDGPAYWAELEPIILEKEQYWQLSLMDITYGQRGLARNIFENDVHGERVALNHLLHNLEEIKKQEVAEEIHGRLHDLMGQRIALLQRFLSQKDDKADYGKLTSLLEDVLQDLRTSSQQKASEQLDNIVNTFSSMGLKLIILGELPARQDWAECFVNMIREGANNAVRHGNASEIVVLLTKGDYSATITISSDGIVPANIEKGKGLQGMERQLQALGGTMQIYFKDRFIITGEVGVKHENINS